MSKLSSTNCPWTFFCGLLKNLSRHVNRIDVILKISDYVTVLKDGNIIGNIKTSEADFDKLALMLLGKQ